MMPSTTYTDAKIKKSATICTNRVVRLSGGKPVATTRLKNAEYVYGPYASHYSLTGESSFGCNITLVQVPRVIDRS